MTRIRKRLLVPDSPQWALVTIGTKPDQGQRVRSITGMDTATMDNVPCILSEEKVIELQEELDCIQWDVLGLS